MKKLILCMAGFLPFFAGKLVDHAAVVLYPDTLLPYPLIGAFFLLLCFFIAFLLYTGAPWQTLFLLHVPASSVLILLFVQEVLCGQYWNGIGLWTQLFYLPLLSIGFSLTSWFHRVFFAYGACFLLMLLAAWFGCKGKQHVQSKKNQAA